MEAITTSASGMPLRGTPLGTGGAFKNVEEQIDSTTVVFNGDVLTSLDLNAVIARHKQAGAAATLVLTPVDNPSAYGLVETGTDGRVQRFIEKPGPAEITCNTINAGVYVLEPSVLRYMPKGEVYSFERGLFPHCWRTGNWCCPIFSMATDRYWNTAKIPRSPPRYSVRQISFAASAGPVRKCNASVAAAGGTGCTVCND